PMLSSRFVKPPHETEHGRFYQASERVFDWALGFYERTLRYAMRHRVATMGVFAATVIATIVLFMVVPTGFIPSEDTGQLQASTEAAPDTSFEAMIRYQQQAAQIVRYDPNVAGVMSSVGGGGGGGSNTGRLTIRL